jgi:hypothetical protein
VLESPNARNTRDSVVYQQFLSYYHEGVRHHTEDTFLVRDDGVEFWTRNCPRELIVPT